MFIFKQKIKQGKYDTTDLHHPQKCIPGSVPKVEETSGDILLVDVTTLKGMSWIKLMKSWNIF